MQMGHVDEISNRQRAVSWTFVDFLEGLARMAEALALPQAWELEIAQQVYLQDQQSPKADQNYKGKFWVWKYMTVMSIGYLDENRRPSFGFVRTEQNMSERSMYDKMDMLLHLMIAGLCDVWALTRVDKAGLTKKLSAQAKALGVIVIE